MWKETITSYLYVIKSAPTWVEASSLKVELGISYTRRISSNSTAMFRNIHRILIKFGTGSSTESKVKVNVSL
jgi:hypothetical protein